MTDDPARAEELSATLDELNRLRQAAEADLAEAAIALAERTYHGERALVVAGEGWHEGVKGIVASRLTNRFGVPTIVFTIDDGVALGSGRSVGSVDLFQALEACGTLLTRFGGHAAAVGCALPAEQMDAFAECLLGYLDALPAEQFETEKRVDAEVELSQISVELGAEFALMEPFRPREPDPASRRLRGVHERPPARRQARQPLQVHGLRRGSERPGHLLSLSQHR